MDPILVSFSAWWQVVVMAREGRPLWYQGPLDARPVRISATCKPHGRTVRVEPFGTWRRGERPFDPFTADASHLDRFRRA